MFDDILFILDLLSERTVEDYSKGALEESEKALAACFTLVRSKGKKDGKFAYTLVPDKCKLIAKRAENHFVFAKKGKKKSRGKEGLINA